MKNSLRLRLVVALALVGVVSFSVPANAAILFGHSSNENHVLVTNSIPIGVGRQYGTVGSVYVTVDNNGQIGYLHYYLRRCTTIGCTESGNGDYIYPVTAVGGTTRKSVNFNTFSGKTTVKLDFNVVNTNWDCTGSGCNGLAGGVSISTTYFYFLYLNGSSSSTSPLNDKSWVLYGTAADTVDPYMNPIGCGVPANPDSCGGDISTPQYIFADTGGIAYEDEAAYGFATPSESDSGQSFTGALSFCESLASSVASSSTAFGIPYGMTYATCFVPGVLVIPSKTSINFFWEQAGLVKTRVPYVYFEEFRVAWASASNASSQEFPEISAPIDIMGSSTSLTIISSASFTRWVSSGTLSSLRGFTTVALYVGFGWFVWNRTRRLFKGI